MYRKNIPEPTLPDLNIFIYRILARLMLVPFNEDDEDRVVTTCDLFDSTSAKDDIKKQSSRLLPFVLHMSKYFKSRDDVTADRDFQMIDQTVTQMRHLLDKKSRMYYALNAFAAVKV